MGNELNPVLGSYYAIDRDVEFGGSLLTITFTINTRTRKNNNRGRFGVRKLIKTTKKIIIN